MRIIFGIVSTVAKIATLVSYQTLLIPNITIRAALIFSDSNVLLTFNKKPLARVQYFSMLVTGL